MEDEKDVFDRALEFLGTKWLEKRGIYDVKVRSVHIDKDKTPKEKPAQYPDGWTDIGTGTDYH